jgi:hypothetical protein
MAIANVTGFSVGQDLQTLLIIPAVGGSINASSLGRLLEFSASPVISELTMSPIDLGGLQLNRNIYHGWNGEMNFGRYNGNLALLQATVMSIFNQTGFESYFTIEAFVYDTTSGQSNTYTFRNAVIANVPIGDFRGTAEVTQRLAFRSQQMLVNGAALTSLSAAGLGTP